MSTISAVSPTALAGVAADKAHGVLFGNAMGEYPPESCARFCVRRQSAATAPDHTPAMERTDSGSIATTPSIRMKLRFA
jgi:hypothetical protein